MTCVRKREQPSAQERAKRRAEVNRQVLVPDPVSPGGRFTGAFGWFRAAAVYAGRRSYRTLAIGEAAVIRRDRIIGLAAGVIQERACEIDVLVPSWFRPQTRRAVFRDAQARAATPGDRLKAAHEWMLFAVRMAERYSDATGQQAAAIQDKAAARLIGWAEEMDSDSYGE
jgi:hypothetical protein